MVDAQDGAPTVKAHAEFDVEQPTQRARAGSGTSPQLRQRRGLSGVGAQQIGDGAQPVVARLGQMQGLIGGLDEFVDHHGTQPFVGAGAGVASTRQCDNGFAEKRIHGEHGGVLNEGAAGIGGNDDEADVGQPVEAMGMPEARWRPRRPVGRRNPGAALSGGGQHAGGRVDQLSLVVGVHVDVEAVGEPASAVGRPCGEFPR